MTSDVTLRSPDGLRGAYVYLCAGTTAMWLVRAEKYPEHHEGGLWFGGRVLWGHEQETRDAAGAVAERWVDDGVLPDGEAS